MVKFDDIKTNVGFQNTADFISSGKFLCEQSGVYLLYVTIDAYNSAIDYDIYVNHSRYVNVLEYNNQVYFQRANIAITLDLHKGDIMWIQLNGPTFVSYYSSCLTIVKIK